MPTTSGLWTSSQLASPARWSHTALSCPLASQLCSGWASELRCSTNEKPIPGKLLGQNRASAGGWFTHLDGQHAPGHADCAPAHGAECTAKSSEMLRLPCDSLWLSQATIGCSGMMLLSSPRALHLICNIFLYRGTLLVRSLAQRLLYDLPTLNRWEGDVTDVLASCQQPDTTSAVCGLLVDSF